MLGQLSRVATSLRLGGAIAFTGCVVGVFSGNCSLAQITPDRTLGTQRSRVTLPIPGVFQIDGGATRGTNLFHSFSQFSVPTNGIAYFNNPLTIENIISRVTGASVSNIDGLIAANGTANLFLINPNGIIFGPNARLDVGGSFVATTANAIRFGKRGFFSATNPQAPGLLTIKPSAFFFNQLSAGTIINQSVASSPISPSYIEGLRVPNGENLVLLGGNVNIDGGRLNAFGGRVEIGAVAGKGIVGLNQDGSLNFPTNLQRGDVSFTNGAWVNVSLDKGGDIGITARNIYVLGESSLIAGIGSSLGTADSQAGDITLNAAEVIQIDNQSTLNNVVFSGRTGNAGDIRISTGSLSVTNGAQLVVVTAGQGNAGNIVINARDSVLFEGVSADGFRSGALSFVEQGAVGRGGKVEITTGSLLATNRGLLSASTFGQGDAGNIIINARDTVSFFDDSTVLSLIHEGAVGNGGNIYVTTGSLFLTNGSQLDASVLRLGRGNAGDVIVNARDTVSLDGTTADGVRASTLFSEVDKDGVGNGGNVIVNTGSLFATNGGRLEAGTEGQGNAGNVIVNARDTVQFDSTSQDGRIVSGALSNVAGNAVGAGGNVEITTGSLFVTNGARLKASTEGQGNAGNVIVNARDTVQFDSTSQDGRIVSGALSNVAGNAVGAGGNVEITTGSLFVTNGAQLDASTEGQGSAGNVIINARDHVSFGGVSPDGEYASGAFSRLEETAVGNGGNIEITTGTLSVTDGAQLQAQTLGQGNAGNVIINARERVSLDGFSDRVFGKDDSGGLIIGVLFSSIFSEVGEIGNGSGGDIRITTGSLSLTNGARLDTSTYGQGDAGSVIIKARDTVYFGGSGYKGIFPGGASSSVEEGAVGSGGNIEITAGSFSVTNGALLTTSTSGQGNAGDIIITARDNVSFADDASSAVREGARGQGGDIRITTGSLSVIDGAQLVTSTSGQGDAGNIIITTLDNVSFKGTDSDSLSSGGAISRVDEGGIGQGGDIRITTGSLSLTNGAQIDASTLGGRGNAGNVFINARDAVLVDGVGSNNGFPSAIFTDTGTVAVGRGGTITIDTSYFRVTNGAFINASTANSDRGGDIFINADRFEAVDGGQVITTTLNNGQAGNITLNVRDSITLSGSDPTFQQRRDRFPNRIANEGNGESGLFANTRPNSTGYGGTITLQTNTLSLADRAQISASSQGTGQAGDVAIAAKTVKLTNSDITTSADQAAGGAIAITADSLSLNRGSITAATGTNGAQGAANITLQGLDLLRMDNESLISANALNQANGGNVTIDSTFIVATSPKGPEGSDITANAIRGNGGRVSLTTQGLFGIEFRPKRTPKNDITVSSDFGLAGVFEQNNPGVDPSRGLTNLPTEPVNTEVSQDCQSGRGQSSFTNTGRSGLPVDPYEPLGSSEILADVHPPTQWVSNPGAATSTSTSPTTPPNQIVEANGWVINEKGEVVLVAKVPLAPSQRGCRKS